MSRKIFIPGNVPSLKNSKQIVNPPGWKHPALIPCKTVKKYIKETAKHWESLKSKFLQQLKGKTPPFKIEFQYIRGSRHRFDYTNAQDTVQDIMVDHGWLEDDNSDILLPVFRPYEYDKENPGVFIRVLKWNH